MMSSGSSSCCSCRAVDVVTKSIDKKMDFALLTIKSPMRVVPRGTSITSTRRSVCGVGVRASVVDSYESSSNFVKRMEQAWLISQVLFMNFHLFLLGIYIYLFFNIISCFCYCLYNFIISLQKVNKRRKIKLTINCVSIKFIKPLWKISDEILRL